MSTTQRKYTDEFKVRDLKLRSKRIDPFEFAAFKTVFGTATKGAEIQKLKQAYSTLTSWLEAEVGGMWIPILDTSTNKFMLPELEDLAYADEVVFAAITNVINPLFQNTTA